MVGRYQVPLFLCGFSGIFGGAVVLISAPEVDVPRERRKRRGDSAWEERTAMDEGWLARLA